MPYVSNYRYLYKFVLHVPYMQFQRFMCTMYSSICIVFTVFMDGYIDEWMLHVWVDECLVSLKNPTTLCTIYKKGPDVDVYEPDGGEREQEYRRRHSRRTIWEDILSHGRKKREFSSCMASGLEHPQRDKHNVCD